MRQALVLSALAALGIGAALVLLRSPDTGGSVPDRERAVVEAPVQRDEKGRELGAPRPEMVAKAERRRAPDARFANVSSSAWTGIKRELSVTDVDQALMDDINELIGDLRSAYLSPDADRIAELAERQDALVARVRALPLPDTVPPLLANLEAARGGMETEPEAAATPAPEPTP